MKKTIITISTLALMSFNSHCIYKQYKLSTALDIVQDLRTWIGEDINNNRISSMLAEAFSVKSKNVKNADHTIAEPIANRAR